MRQSEEHQKMTNRFYKYQVLYFEFLAIWKVPQKRTQRQHRFHQLRFVIVALILGVLLTLFAIRVLGNLSRLRVIIKVFFIFSTELSCLAKYLNILLKNDQLNQIIALMHAPIFHPRSKAELVLFSTTELMVTKIRNWYAAMSLVAVHFLLLTQFIVDYTQLPLSMYEPCDIGSPGCYYVLYLLQYVGVTMSCCVNITYDSLALALLLYVPAQLDLLISRLENLGAAETPTENQHIAQDLRACYVCYDQVLKLKDLVESFVKIPGSVQIFCSVLVLVCNFYDMSTSSDDTANMVKTVIYQFVMLQQIFMICYAANEITWKAAYLSHALYKSQWRTWNPYNRKLCLMMMQRFDVPLRVRTNALFLQHFSLMAFTSIVNSSYSYFALLKRVNS